MTVVLVDWTEERLEIAMPQLLRYTEDLLYINQV